MANFGRQFPGGAPTNGTLPSTAIEYFDAALPKLPNATDGSTHTGSCEFGGLKAPHMTRTAAARETINETGPAPQVISRVLDCNVAGSFFLEIDAQDPGNWTLTLDIRNTRVGDTIEVVIGNGVYVGEYALTLVWAGAGLTHSHAPFEDQTERGETVVFRGQVFETGKIMWTADRLVSS